LLQFKIYFNLQYSAFITVNKYQFFEINFYHSYVYHPLLIDWIDEILLFLILLALLFI